jgi:acetate kinase
MKQFKFKKCDPFFACLPESARLYAIPYALSQKGFYKNPQKGAMFHSALEKINHQMKKRYRRVVMVLFDGPTRVIGLQDGRPIDVSDHFSEGGGILSETGCGEIDSSIVFQLLADGVGLDQVERLLSQGSGFKALCGRPVHLKDLLGQRDRKSRFAQEVFSYQLLKHIGTCVASLGGVDLILFLGHDHRGIRTFSLHLVDQLRFLGIKKRKKIDPKGDAPWSTKDSLVSVLFLKTTI